MSRQQNSNYIAPPTTLRIASWNAAGLKNKLTDLATFISLNRIDIMVVTETHLIRDDEVSIKGYYLYPANHTSNRRRGGAAIFIKTSIRHIAIQIDTAQKVQCSAVSVSLHNGQAINISAIYLQPQESWTTNEFKDLFNKLGERFLVLGDWNAKSYWWGNPRSNARGTALLQSVQSNNYNILATGSPTHYPTNTRHSPSAIDFGIYRGLKRDQLKIYSQHDLCSDHLPLVIELHSCPQVNKSKCYLLPLNASLRKFQFYLNNHILLDTEINTADDIEDCTHILERNLKLAAQFATPRQRSALHSANNQITDFQTLQLIRDRRIIKRLLTGNLNMQIKQTYNHLTSQIRRLLRQAEQNRLGRLLESLEPDNRFNMQKLWRITSVIKRQPTPNLPVKKYDIINADDSWCKSSEEKAEAFSQHLQSRFTTTVTTSQVDLEQIEQSTAPISNSTSLPFRSVTATEIQEQIKLLQNKKSPGDDNIDNRTLKALPKIAIEYFALLFNKIIQIGHFPSKWKHAIIKMLHKPGKPCEQLSSYRPISLLSGISKIFETLLLKRMFEHDPFADAIPSHQFGFRKQHGAEQQLGRVTQFILKSFEKGEYCSAVYLDIQEAFDRVWHKGLFFKLGRILPEALYRIICNYLTDRTFAVECSDGVRSSTKQVSAGVPQGSVLGPILYTVYASDIPAPQYPDTSLIATYADDTAIISSSQMATVAVKRVENYLKLYMLWANKWCITVNVNKTAHVMHSLRNITPDLVVPTPKLNATALQNNRTHTYLGIKLDTKLILHHHVQALRIKLWTRIKRLHWLLNNNCKLPLKTRVIVYKQLIAPIWQYSLPIWGSLVSELQLSRIRVIQNRALRLITNADWHVRNTTLHADLNVKQVDEVFETMCAKYAERLFSHSNPEARNIAQNPYRPFRLSRPRYNMMLQRCFPVQQQATQPQSPSSSSDEEPLPADLPARRYSPVGPSVRISRCPAYRHYLATGEMDATFGELRFRPGLAFSTTENSNSLPPLALQGDLRELLSYPSSNIPITPWCLLPQNTGHNSATNNRHDDIIDLTHEIEMVPNPNSINSTELVSAILMIGHNNDNSNATPAAAQFPEADLTVPGNTTNEEQIRSSPSSDH